MSGYVRSHLAAFAAGLGTFAVCQLGTAAWLPGFIGPYPSTALDKSPYSIFRRKTSTRQIRMSMTAPRPLSPSTLKRQSSSPELVA